MAVERHETRSVAFSPDERLIAVTLAHEQSDSENYLVNTHLLLLSADNPQANVRQFDLTRNCGVDLTWNERGDAILVCGAIVRLSDGTSCVVNSPPPLFSSLWREFGPGRAFWLDSEHVVRSNGETLDARCKQVGAWKVEPNWPIAGVAASKGWVHLWHWQGPREKTVYQYSIVDVNSHQRLNGWPTPKMESVGGLGDIAAGAGAFCFSLYGKLHCRLVVGGMDIPLPKRLRDYSFNTGANSSSRIVVEKESRHDPWWESLLWWWVPVPGYPVLPRRRVIVDLRSGSAIASWKARIQDSRSPHVEDWPYHCALSPTGEFLAESGDGVLELYRLAP
jgi:hypothetical protein